VSNNDLPASQNFSSTLSKIKEVSDYQKALYEDLSRKIQQIDERLVELDSGVEAKVEIPMGEVDGNGNDHASTSNYTDFLGFHRGPKGWHLHFMRRNQDQKKVVYHQLLSEARRDFQIRAVEQLPKLIEELAQEAEKRTDEIRNSLDLAENIAESLE
jgi:hypothetical protein